MPGERRTLIVIVVTATMMVVEIVAGLAFGSMALLADGLHMASHTVALAIAYFAYIYARRHARDERFSFGTGKVNPLAGFTGAILLAVFAITMVAESIDRFVHPVVIRFNQAILVAVLGLAVNALSAVVLSGRKHAEHDHDHGHADDHDDAHHGDHNLRAAYLHVLADALTSLLAIFALLAGKYSGATWMDPLMGVVGAVLVARWSLGLIRTTSRVLLDHQAPERMRTAIREAIEAEGTTHVLDLHVWSLGSGRYAAIIALASDARRSAAEWKAVIPSGLGLAHVTVETNRPSDSPTSSDGESL